MNVETNDIDVMANSGYSFGNFDPALIQDDEVILVVLCVDISPSIEDFEADLNDAFEQFLLEMQKSHVADKLLIKVIVFNENVEQRTAFMPIKTMTVADFKFKASGMGTALYEAAWQGNNEAINYRQTLEQTGINCKCLVFVITDGWNNSGLHSGADVKKQLTELHKEERNFFSYETILFGIGGGTKFKDAQIEMGFKHLAQTGNSGHEVRKLIGFVSASISQSASNAVVTF